MYTYRTSLESAEFLGGTRLPVPFDFAATGKTLTSVRVIYGSPVVHGNRAHQPSAHSLDDLALAAPLRVHKPL